MDARPAAATFFAAVRQTRTLATLVQSVVYTTSFALLVVSSFMAVRRSLRIASAPVDAATVLVAAFSMVAVVSVLRGATRRVDAGRGNIPRSDLFVSFVLPTIASVLLGIAICTPGTSANAVVAFCTIVGVGELYWWRPLAERLIRNATGQTRERPPALPSPARSDAILAPQDQLDEASFPQDSLESDEEIIPHDVVQQLTRSRDAQGAELIHGLLRGTFESGERSQSLHVAFCPPLERAPEVSAAQIEGPTLDLKVGETQTYGARLDLRLNKTPVEPVTVVVHYEARVIPAPQ